MTKPAAALHKMCIRDSLGPARCDLLLPAVIHNPDLIDVCDLGAFSGVAGVPLHTAEYTPDAGDGGRLIPQHPLPANSQSAVPLAVLLQILVHHGKELLDRGRLLGIRKLAANGPGQGTFLRNQGVPQAPVSQNEPHQNRSGPHHGDQVIACLLYTSGYMNIIMEIVHIMYHMI